MTLSAPTPLVGVPACRILDEGRAMHRVGEKYLSAVMDVSECAAIMVPALSGKHDFSVLIDRLDGIFLPGSPSNIEPDQYNGPASRRGTLHDPDRDNTTLPLIREAVAAGLPIFAVCRGIQELNVALGGALHQQVHEIPGKLDHRMDRRLPPAERFVPRHRIDLTPGGVLQRIADGADSAIVNSAHAQAIDQPADRLFIEAISEDGVIEAVSLKGAATFVLGVQWHPEHPLAIETPLSIALFRAFGDACRNRARLRQNLSQPTRAA